MVCNNCSGKTRVINSRFQKRQNQTWRRRRCLECSTIYTTEETTHYGLSWVVWGKNDSLKPFSRDKLFLSLYNCLQHRSNPTEEAAELAQTVINRLRPHLVDTTLTGTQVKNVVLVVLSRFDQAAAVQYRALHP